MKRIGSLFALTMLIGLVAVSCRTVREVPVTTIEKVVVKDSLIFIHDTLTYEIERIVEKAVMPVIDTSRLETPLAYSEAYVDTTNMKLNHTLEQKGSIEVPVDTIVSVEYVDRIIEQEVPVVTEVVKYRYDALFWVSISLNILVLLIILLRIWLRK